MVLGFPGSSDSKEFARNAGDPGLIPGLGRSPGEGNDYPLQYSCLENSMDSTAWWATVHVVAKRWTQLSNFQVSGGSCKEKKKKEHESEPARPKMADLTSSRV